jgi:ribosomal protein S1
MSIRDARQKLQSCETTNLKRCCISQSAYWSGYWNTEKRNHRSITKGQVLEGVVKNITSYGVFIDLGGVDGLIHITALGH